jgi:uncharacterized membrane protein
VDSEVRSRFLIETALAAVSGILGVLTLVTPDWVELVFHVEPDQGSGALEWALVAALASAAILFAGLARAEWRRAQPSQR